MKGRRLSPVTRSVLIIICLIVFFVLLENMLNLASTVRTETVVKKEQDKIQEEYKKTEEYQQEIYIEKSIEKTVELFKNEDYEALYNHLEPRYKLCVGIDSPEELKTYIDKVYGDKPNSIRLLEFDSVYDRLNCKVTIDTEGEMIIQNLVVIPSGDENFYLMFEDVKEIREYTEKFSTVGAKLKYKLNYKMRRDNDYVCTFEITNRTSETLTGSLEKMSVMTTTKKTYNISNGDELSNIVLAPNETKTLMYKIDISSGTYTDDMYVDFVFTESNGQEIKQTLIMADL